MSDTPDIPELLEVNSRFLHAEDLKDKQGQWSEYTLTVSKVHAAGSLFQEDAQGRKGQPIPHQVLEFEQGTKMLVLTSLINKRRLKTIHGLDLPGKPVTLYPVAGKWFLKRGEDYETLGIRVRVPPGIPMPRESAKDVGRDLTKEAGAASH